MSSFLKHIAVLFLWLVAWVLMGAQGSQRDSVLVQARYLKSIYRIDDAVEALSALVQPGVMD